MLRSPTWQVYLVLRRTDADCPGANELVQTTVYRDSVASSGSASPLPARRASPEETSSKSERGTSPSPSLERSGSGLEALVKSLGGVVRRLSGSDKKEQQAARLPNLSAWLWKTLLLTCNSVQASDGGVIGCPQSAAAQLLMLLHAVMGAQRDLAMAELRSVCSMSSLEQETEEFGGCHDGSKAAYIKLTHSWWVPKGCKVDRAYAARASRRFGADVYCRNQGGDNPGDVRGWVLLNSDCRMQHALPPLPPHRLTLLSCVRVRAPWTAGFDTAETYVSKFWRGRESRNVCMMRRRGTVRCREGKVRAAALLGRACMRCAWLTVPVSKLGFPAEARMKSVQIGISMMG
jgi:hypothetical protein